MCRQEYQVGMYGGSFDPLHMGHVRTMTQAAVKCDELYIVLSYSRKRDHTPMEYRYRWIYNSIKHFPNVKIICLEDTAVSKDDYTQEYWEKGRDEVLAAIGKPVDVVFCGTDYIGSNRYEKLYHCAVEYVERSIIPVSSTLIRGNELKYWDYLPQVVRQDYVKKVLLIGTESAGKSTMVKKLAHIYNTNYVEEVGRDVCEYAGGEEYMVLEDFQEILLRHKVRELDAVKQSNKLLFVDTDALTTKFYSGFLLEGKEEKKKNDMLADAIAGINHYDLILFLEPGIFVQDGTRSEEIASDPSKYGKQIKALFDAHGFKYQCIDGNYEERFKKACLAVEKCLDGE